MATPTPSSGPTPALPPPPGMTSNFEDPPNLVQAVNIAMGVAVPLTTIFFGLRTYIRIFVRRTWIFEDWLALTAWIGTVSFAGVGAATMAHNGGKHGWDITPAQAQEASYWFNVASIHYGITICIAKLAVLWLYRRVFSPHRWRPFDIAIVFLITLLILFYTATNLVKIWECVPREKIWDTDIPGTCIDTPMLLNVSGIFNTVTDFIILLLPVKAVWTIDMSPKKKVIVVLVFTFGLWLVLSLWTLELGNTELYPSAPAFSLVGTLVRIQGSGNPDKTWVQPDIIMWGLAELTTGVLCVSLPELGPLWKKKERTGPSASIVDGKYRQEDTVYRGQGSHGFSTVISHRMRKLESDPYIELDETDLYDPQASTQGAHDTNNHHERPGEVAVTREFRVESV
ncbi:hypothetical protein F4779DRAFT_622829 [Xylariaceae sp. FL0662B]|nr:hypothetical protein F4779DRAFT_622829 [Xylariaceae sp. FL0662B]